MVTEVDRQRGVDASGLNVDREADLIAVDSNGNQVSNVTIDPDRARVRVAVARELANVTLPVVPQIVGVPAPGYRITSVTVEPLVVTVSGEESIVSQMQTAQTEAIDVGDRTSDLEASVPFELPEGVSVSGNDTARVVVTIAERDRHANVPGWSSGRRARRSTGCGSSAPTGEHYPRWPACRSRGGRRPQLVATATVSSPTTGGTPRPSGSSRRRDLRWWPSPHRRSR